jgi:hypothetical protein
VLSGRADHLADSMGYDEPVSLSTMADTAPAAFWDASDAAVIAWGRGQSVYAQSVEAGPPLAVSGPLYSTGALGSAVVAVDVARSGTLVAAAATHATGPAELLLWERPGSAPTIRPFQPPPAAPLPIRGRVSIAMDGRAIGLAMRSGGSVQGSAVWLVHVGADGTMRAEQIATVDDARAGGPWIFASPEGWIVGYVALEAGMPYAAYRIANCF